MAKSANQKLKLLYLLKLLREQSDEDHPIAMQEIIAHLEANDIRAERKSIYDDMEALRQFGIDVVGSRKGYYIGQREFELPELKLLVDSVQSSKFITHRKTLSLIKKIEGLASVHEGKLLQRQVFVRNRVKSMNESIYYHVDEISAAISGDRSIRFRYFEYTAKKERRYRHDGAWYEVSPFALMWDDENYYLLAWDGAAGMLKHYRVDKMADISQTEQVRQGKEAFAAVDMSAYSQRVFGMFTGHEERVRLRFCNRLAGAVLDRFGQDIILVPDGDGHFIVTLPAVISPQFFAWVFGFGEEVELLSPAHVREAFTAQARAIAAMYRE